MEGPPEERLRAELAHQRPRRGDAVRIRHAAVRVRNDRVGPHGGRDVAGEGPGRFTCAATHVMVVVAVSTRHVTPFEAFIG